MDDLRNLVLGKVQRPIDTNRQPTPNVDTSRPKSSNEHRRSQGGPRTSLGSRTEKLLMPLKENKQILDAGIETIDRVSKGMMTIPYPGSAETAAKSLKLVDDITKTADFLKGGIDTYDAFRRRFHDKDAAIQNLAGFLIRTYLTDDRSRPVNTNTNLESGREDNSNINSKIYKYQGLEEGKVVEYTQRVGDIIQEFESRSEKSDGSTHRFSMNDLKTNASGDEIMITNRSRLRKANLELADSFYWGISINRRGAESGKTDLSPFPPPYDTGWWPITSASFTKSSVKSKSLKLPFVAIDIPITNERPSNLKLEVIDDAKRSIRYWLDDYADKVFNFSDYTVLPYKRLVFDVIVYQYDITLNTIYRKHLLCVIANNTNSFTGNDTHSAETVDIDFSIVGEVIYE